MNGDVETEQDFGEQTAQDAMFLHHGNLALNQIRSELDCPAIIMMLDPEQEEVYVIHNDAKKLSDEEKQKMMESLKIYLAML